MSCDWPIDPGQCCELPEGTDPDLVESAVRQASVLMRTLSGGLYGLCDETLRPLQLCPTCRPVSCCGGADGIPLVSANGSPIAEVTAVRVGATEVTDFWFDRASQILWRNPPARWPRRDPKWQAPGTGDAFVVDVVSGIEPDEWALSVAGSLVCELVKSCTGGDCRIPANTTQLTAQGVTITLDPDTFATMLPEVAGWVRAVNPRHAKAPAMVWSPDLNRRPVTPGGPHWLR